MEGYQQMGRIFKELGHPDRLRILTLLGQEEEACVCHMEAQLGLRQAAISQHLMRLRDAGLVADRREGTKVFYRLENPAIRGLLKAGEGLVAEAPAPGMTLIGIDPCPCSHCQSI